MLQNANHIRTCVEPSCIMVPNRVQRDVVFLFLLTRSAASMLFYW